MNDSDAMGTLIRSSRLEQGLTRDQVASAVGRSSSTVRRWERGESTPTDDVLGDLATVLGLDTDRLVALKAPAEDHEVVSEPASESEDDVEEDSDVAADTPRVRTTIEDDDVVAEVGRHYEAPAPTGPPLAESEPSRYARASVAVWGRRDSWIGWVRGFFTALALVFLFMGLVWALGELLTALKDVLGSFSTGA